MNRRVTNIREKMKAPLNLTFPHNIINSSRTATARTSASYRYNPFLLYFMFFHSFLLCYIPKWKLNILLWKTFFATIHSRSKKHTHPDRINHPHMFSAFHPTIQPFNHSTIQPSNQRSIHPHIYYISSINIISVVAKTLCCEKIVDFL